MSTEGALEMLLDRIPPEVAETFTPAQRAALWSAVKPTSMPGCTRPSSTHS